MTSRRPSTPPRGRLEKVVADLLPDSDPETRAVVTALVGLLASVAYADAVYHPSEKETVRRELARVHVLDDRAVRIVAELLETHIKAIVAAGDQTWARTIKETLDRDGRIEVLDALLEIAAADGELSTHETNYLRRVAPKLGLTQQDYVVLQSKHRDKLSVLEQPGGVPEE